MGGKEAVIIHSFERAIGSKIWDKGLMKRVKESDRAMFNLQIASMTERPTNELLIYDDFSDSMVNFL